METGGTVEMMDMASLDGNTFQFRHTGSVQSIVLARINSLRSEDRRAIQTASVIGQRFSPDALEHVADQADYRCDGLVERSLIRPDGSEFSFTHALVRDGVYASLLGEAKPALHGRAATWFDGHDPALHAQHLGHDSN